MAKQPAGKNAAAEPGKFMSAVKVGPKGQVVIPKEVREMFNIAPGDMLLFLADESRGMALHRMDYFNRIADEIFTEAGGAPEGSAQREAGVRFAKSVHEAQDKAQDGEEKA